MSAQLLTELEPALEPGEQVLWAARPQRRSPWGNLVVPSLMLLVGAGILGSHDQWGSVFRMDAWPPVALGATAAILLAIVLVPFGSYVRMGRTVYALTDRRLMRVLNGSVRRHFPENRGWRFSYRPEELEMLEYNGRDSIYFERKSTNTTVANNHVFIGFIDVAGAEQVHARIQAWFDDWQQRRLAGSAERRTVTNDDYGFQLEVPASWTAETGNGGDTDAPPAPPANWEEMRPWSGESSGWNRLRVTGPEDATLAIEALRAPGRRNAAELSPMDRRLLKLVGGERAEVEFSGMPATLTTWTEWNRCFRLLVVPYGEVEYRIHLLTRSTMSRLMNELQTFAESIRLREVETPSTGG